MSDTPAGGVTGGAVRAFLWAVGSFGGRKLVSFVGTLVLARILVPEDFGLVAAGVAILTYMEFALDLGVASTVIYEQEEGITDRVHTAFTVNLAFGVILFVVGFLAAPAVAWFFQAPGEETLFRVLFLFLLCKAAGQVPDAVLRRNLDFRRRLLAELARAGIKVMIAIPLAMAGAGAWSLVLGMVIGEAVATVVTWFAARFRPRLRLDRSAMRTLLRYGSTMLGVRVVSELANSGDYLVVGNRLGPEELGVYSIAYRIPELALATVFWLYSMVAFPVYARAGALEGDKLRSGMLRAMTLTTLLVFPSSAGLALVADDAVRLFFSDRWEAAIVPMVVMSLSLGIGAVSVAAADVLPAVGKPGKLLLANLVLLPPTLVTMVLVAPRGLVAIALVELVSVVVYVPLLQLFVNREVGTSAREVGRACVPALSATVGMLVLAVPMQLLLAPGTPRLLVTVAAGIVGAGVGILAGGRTVVPEIQGILRLLRPGAS